MGFPPFSTGMAEAPFDYISDMFRLTLGASLDLIEQEDEVKAACDRLTDITIANLQYLNDPNTPVKRVFFPLHKGMDGFMSEKQYAEIYWAPFRRVIDALVAMDVTPYIYTEGPYNTRLEYIAENIPEKKCIIHIENADMAKAKATVGQVSCISGNLPVYDLMHADPKTISEKVKRLLDICMPGGGYIFDTDCAIDKVKPENLEALFETVREYGVY